MTECTHKRPVRKAKLSKPDAHGQKGARKTSMTGVCTAESISALTSHAKFMEL